MLILEWYPSWAGKPESDLRSVHINKQEDINRVDWLVAKGNGASLRLDGNFVKVGHGEWIVALVVDD